MSEFYDEYTDDELTNEFDSKAQIIEEASKSVSSVIEKATKNVNDIIEEERKKIMQKKNVEQNNNVEHQNKKKNFKQEIEGKSIKGTSIETEKKCVIHNITKL